MKKRLIQAKNGDSKNVTFNQNNQYSDDESSLDSDQELQIAFANNKLKPGLNIQIEKPKDFVNDEDRLEKKAQDLHLKMDWVERMDVVVLKNTIKLDDLDENDSNNTDLAKNDFKRESLFLRQAENSISIALPRLNKLNIKTKRADDYFAEMAKSDEHMKRVKEKLLSRHAEMEKREKIRKLRELKKLGKQIQQEVEKKKLQNKKKLSESIKKFKKGDKDSLKIELEDAKDIRKSAKKKETGLDKKNKSNKKALYKEKKYGFGGRKKRSKYNTAESYAEGYAKKSPKNLKSQKFKTKTVGKKLRNKNKPKLR